MNDRLILTDELLRQAFAKRMAQSPSPQLLDRIVTGAGGTSQAPVRWTRWPLRRRLAPEAAPRPRWRSVPALAGVAVVLAVSLTLFLAFRPARIGPGGTPSPRPTATSPATPSEPPSPTAVATLLGDHAAVRLHLGTSFEAVDPIDLTFADGSIWTADIHADDVRRFDPATLELQAVIPLPSPAGGPGWFATTPGAVWVSNQLGNGLTRIDPATNTVVVTLGDGGTCGAPVVAFDHVWQSMCDPDTFLRIDPATNALETIPAKGHGFLVAAGGRLITTVQNGLASLDPETFAFRPLTTSFGRLDVLLGAGGGSVWVSADGAVLRIDPADGATVATLRYQDVRGVAFSADHAWLTVGTIGSGGRGGIVEIDLATNAEVQVIPFGGSPLLPLEAAGALWVTDFDNSDLWRIEP